MSHNIGLSGEARAEGTGAVSLKQYEEVIRQACPVERFREKRVLVIIPDGTRKASIGPVFQGLYRHLDGIKAKVDVMIALGTHQPMGEAAILKRLEITAEERTGNYGKMEVFNHQWDDEGQLRQVGEFSEEEIQRLSQGQFSMKVPVEINKRVFNYDELIIIGPVLPHEVVGFSGGNKYLFPGIGGPRILNFFHWLGAVITNPMIIGTKWTPVRKVVDRAAAMIPIRKTCFCLVPDSQQRIVGLFAGAPEAAWDAASDLSNELRIIYKDRPYRTILSCAPGMYEDLWTGGKCMYKLEPIVEDGGELIIYAPHIRQVSVTHGKILEEIGYHCRDYFVKQWDRFQTYPWGLLAHSSHVRGIGIYEEGVERPRIQVTLATGISPEMCRKINLGYRDPATLRVEDYVGKEDQGVFYVPEAGEMLYRLKNAPAWAGGAV